MKTYNFKAKVTDKKTGKETIVSGEYETKYHFITDLHNNGYSVERETVILLMDTKQMTVNQAHL